MRSIHPIYVAMTARQVLSAFAVAALTLSVIAGPELPRRAFAQALPQQPQPMWVSVRRYEGVPDPKKAGQVVRDTWIPIISKIPGFMAYDWVDAGNGVMVSTSVFKTKEGQEASNAKVKQWRMGNPAANAVLPNPPQITAGEVLAAEVQ